MKVLKTILIAPCLAIALVLLLPSCGPRKVTVHTNAFADAQVIPYGFTNDGAFAVMHANNENSMLAKEVSKKIEDALDYRGYLITERANADYYLLFSYEMRSSTSIANVAKYVPGQTVSVWGKNGYEQIQSSGSTVYVPEEVTVFTKILKLSVYSCNNLQEACWQASVSCTDGSSDLREIMDYLISAAFKQFGKNTKKNINEVYKIK